MVINIYDDSIDLTGCGKMRVAVAVKDDLDYTCCVVEVYNERSFRAVQERFTPGSKKVPNPTHWPTRLIYRCVPDSKVLMWAAEGTPEDIINQLLAAGVLNESNSKVFIA